MIFNAGLAKRILSDQNSENFLEKERGGVLVSVIDFFWDGDKSSNEHVWPVSICNIINFFFNIS